MQPLNYNYDKKRFETFIDAVIAIILTILVLELKVPEGGHSENASTQQQLFALIPVFVSYLGSFMLIVGIWIDHHLLFLNIEKITKRYIIFNMVFILLLSVIPFTTAFAGNHYKDPFAVALLFVNYVAMNMAFTVLYYHANKKGILHPGFFADNKKTGIYSLLGLVGLVAAIPLAYVHTYISFALGIIIFGGHLSKRK